MVPNINLQSATWTKEYDRAIKKVVEWMAAAEREEAATVDSVVQAWNTELIDRRASLRDAHLAAMDLLSRSWTKAELQEATKVVGNLVCLADGCETLRRQMSDTAHIERALSERRQLTNQSLDEARAELLQIARATAVEVGAQELRPSLTVVAPAPMTIPERSWACVGCSAIVPTSQAMLAGGHRNGVYCQGCFDRLTQSAALPAAAVAELNVLAAEDHALEVADLEAADPVVTVVADADIDQAPAIAAVLAAADSSEGRVSKLIQALAPRPSVGQLQAQAIATELATARGHRQPAEAPAEPANQRYGAALLAILNQQPRGQWTALALLTQQTGLAAVDTTNGINWLMRKGLIERGNRGFYRAICSSTPATVR